MAKHPNKSIQAALEYAKKHGLGNSAFWALSSLFCRLRCKQGHTEHQMSIWSTPRNPENHAKQILRKVKECGEL